MLHVSCTDILQCMCALLTCIGIFVWSNHQRKKTAEKAQQVVLAAFIKDRAGRVLVTPEGLLPSEKITGRFDQRVSFLRFLIDIVFSLCLVQQPQSLK